jgi:hypothetical protein
MVRQYPNEIKPSRSALQSLLGERTITMVPMLKQSIIVKPRPDATSISLDPELCSICHRFPLPRSAATDCRNGVASPHTQVRSAFGTVRAPSAVPLGSGVLLQISSGSMDFYPRRKYHRRSSTSSGTIAQMAEERVQRRLAAIVVADVVGYSRLMEEDEVATLAVLRGAGRQFSSLSCARMAAASSK